MNRKTLAPRPLLPAPTIAGARPVVGSIGASGLMLLACSWFAFGASGLSPFHRDVGATDLVRIQTPATPSLAPAHEAPAVTATHRAPDRHVAVHSARAHVSQSVGVVRAPQPESRRPTSAPARPAAPEASKPAAATGHATAPVPTQTPPSPTPPPAPTLPAPLDTLPLPTVSLPPISVPALPTVTVQVPDLPTPTLPLGLP
jgi:hypothetical protein